MKNKKLKIFTVLAFSCLFLLGHSLCVSADTPNRHVKAGIFNFDGYHMKDRDGELKGYGIDLLGLLSEYSHLDFEFSGYDKSWQDMLKMLKNGEIDILTSARRTPEREELYAFSLPVGRNSTVLSVQINNNNLRGGDYSTYEGMIVGELSGSSQNRRLEDFAREKGFTYKTRQFSDPALMAKALQAGEVDAILSSSLRKTNNEKLLDVINVDNFYVIARKEDQELINEINYAIEQMNLNEGDWENDLYYRYYGPEYTNSLFFTDRERQYIGKVQSGEKKIVAAARGDAPPYSYMENGALKGILPDYFSRVMAAAAMPYELVQSDKTTEDQEIPEGVNVVLDRTSPPSAREGRSQDGFTTDPYMTTGLARVMRQDFKGEVKKVAVSAKGAKYFDSALPPNAEVELYPSAADAMRAVEAGEADAALVFPHAAQLFVNHDPENSLYYTMLNGKGASFRMYIPATADHELITILNKSAKNLPEGTLNQLESRYTSFAIGDMSIGHYLRANPAMIFAGAIFAAMAISLGIITILRYRWNKRMLAATEHANRELEGQLSIVEALSRDYSNVFAINENSGTARIIKLKGYTPNGLIPDSQLEQPYAPLFHTYVKDRVHPDDQEYLANALSLETIRGKLSAEYSGTYRIIDADGATHHYQFTCVMLREKQEKNDIFILLGFRNIDEMIRREKEQKARLAEALAQARYASAAKTAFLNNMSHDIRTPMNAIIGFTSLAVSHIGDTARMRDYLGKIMTSGNHLLSLINDVLDMSRIESGKMKIDEKETSLPEILHDLKTIAQADIKAKQLNFQMDSNNVLNETIFCDRLRLNQVLLNILSNAMKYTNPGGTVAVRLIQTEPAQAGMASYEFSVRDTGIGMSEEFLAHVFEPFEREHTSTVSGIQGTGLGLAITKNIVNMMGGTISVQSEPGKGSEFTVSFRFRVVAADECSVSMPELEGLRALVVDDDVNACTSVCRMLSSLGMRPDWTTLGKEAVIRTGFALEQNDAYSTYLVDWVMPDMDGIELARRIRKLAGSEVPIIILTSYDWADIEAEAYKAGVTAFCSKPVFLSQLKNVLANPIQGKTSEHKEPDHAQRFAGKSILLAEDNEMNQEIAQLILENAGFTLEIVDDGAKAVRRMEEMPAGTYDLILMDVQMPVMNGYDATRKIRALKDSSKAAIPIIAMTANAFAEDRQEAMDAGMNGYVPKPIDIKNLMRTLEDFV